MLPPVNSAAIWGGSTEAVLAEHDAVAVLLRWPASYAALLNVGEPPVMPYEYFAYVVAVVAGCYGCHSKYNCQ